MQNLLIDSPENLYLALNQGKKVAIFEIDDEKKPIFLVSGLSLQKLPENAKNEDIIAPAIKYVHDNYNKELRLDTLADKCDLSKSYFCRLFATRYGMGVNEYVTKFRLQRACKLLAETSMPVVNIAFEVGYPDCGYFHKIFKKHFNCTPLEYRNAPTLILIE